MPRWAFHILAIVPAAQLLLSCGGAQQAAIPARIGAESHGTVLAIRSPVAPAAATEIIVRDDRGDTISVVQDDARGLRPGARVAIIRGGPARVQPDI